MTWRVGCYQRKCERQYYGVASSWNKYKQNCIDHRTEPCDTPHNKLAKYNIIESNCFVHVIIKNIIVDMKWFDPSLIDGNYFQLKYLI